MFSDSETQVFEADGQTTYVENGRPTRGEWYVDDDGHFGSFWPPSYRASYDLRWMVEDREPTPDEQAAIRSALEVAGLL